MKTKLCTFYLNCILPELLDPQRNRNMDMRNSAYILQAIKNKKGVPINANKPVHTMQVHCQHQDQTTRPF